MSFKAELEALIANANSSLEDLEAVLRRAQTRSSHVGDTSEGDGDVAELQAQIDSVHQKVLSSLLQIRESYNHDQQRLSELEGELKLDLENVRQCAIDYFIKGEYRDCERLLTFLAKVQPDDENLKNFLDLSRRKQLENEKQTACAAAIAQPFSNNGNSERQLSHQNHVQAPYGPPNRRPSGGDVEPPRPGFEVTTLPLAAGAPTRVSQPDPEESETLKPRILAEIELKTAAHINETYQTPASSRTPRFVVWAVLAAFGVATTIYWISRSGMVSFVAEDLLGSQSSAEELVSAKDPLGGLRKEAQALFAAGKLQEAGRVCDAILSRDAEDSFAVSFKDTILAASAQLKNPSQEGVPFKPTSEFQEPAESQLPETQSTNLQARSRPVSSDMLSPPKKAAAPPTPVAPTTPAASQVSAVPQIRPDQLLELNSRIEGKDFGQARLLLERLENGFPGNPDVKRLGERLREERGIQQRLALSWIDKAREAQIAGRYVTPRADNVLVYCNLALKADPGNQTAANLKREIVERAIGQAGDWIQQGKFDAATQYYASMNFLALGDSGFPFPKADFKRQLDKLEFTSYPMVHDHRLSSCSGILKFNSYAVSYVPSGGSDHGFVENLGSVAINDEGERLKISCPDRNFRFRSEKGDAIQTIYRQLMTRITDEKSILSTRNNDIR